MIRSSHRVNVTLGVDRTRFYDASELRTPSPELFPFPPRLSV